MGFFDFLFPNPSDEAQKYLQQIPGTIKPYYQPYVQAGEQAIPQLQGQYNQLLGGGQGLQSQFSQMMQNPGGFYGKLAGGYQQSPGFQNMLSRALNAAHNESAAGGMSGTAAAQRNAADIAADVSNKDFGNYLSHIMNILGLGQKGMGEMYGKGLSGLEGLGKLGYTGASELASNLGQGLTSQGQIGYAGQANQNQMLQGLLHDVMRGMTAYGTGGMSELGGMFGGGWGGV